MICDINRYYAYRISPKHTTTTCSSPKKSSCPLNEFRQQSNNSDNGYLIEKNIFIKWNPTICSKTIELVEFGTRKTIIHMFNKMIVSLKFFKWHKLLFLHLNIIIYIVKITPYIYITNCVFFSIWQMYFQIQKFIYFIYIFIIAYLTYIYIIMLIIFKWKIMTYYIILNIYKKIVNNLYIM